MIPQFHIGDIFTIGNLVILLAIYGKMRVMTYQHTLMWRDFEKRKGINGGEQSHAAGE